MDMHDFEAWVARRDPDWYAKPLEAIYALRQAYSDDENLAAPFDFPKYLLRTDMQAAKTQANKPQLSLF